MAMDDIVVYDWDSEIENDDEGFVLLEPGIYAFEVVGMEKAYYDGGAKMPPCPKAVVKLRCTGPSGSAVITDNFMLNSSMEWKISGFFRSIGYKQHGQRVTMNWDAEWLKGQRGACEVEVREFTFTRGERAGEKGKSNQIKRYIDPQGDDANAGGGDDW